MKKPSLIIGKKQIILSCLTLMLAVAIYVNYAMTQGDGLVDANDTAQLRSTVSYGDTEFVSAGTAQNPTAPATDATQQETETTDETELPLATDAGQSAAEYFAQARLERTASRDESVAALQSMIGGGDCTEEERITDAIAAVETSQLMESESNIESIVKSMGYADCIVYLDSDSAKVVVQTEGLDTAQAAAIKDVILGEVTIPAENIRLFEVK